MNIVEFCFTIFMPVILMEHYDTITITSFD